MSRIRELIPGDIPEAVEILATTEPWISLPGAKENLQRNLRAALGRGTVFIAEDEAAPAGVASFTPEPVLGGGGCIQFIVVRSDKRRRGIGRQLMGFVERKVFDQSLSVYTCIASSNQPAVQFLEKLGYLRVGEVSDSMVSEDAAVIFRKTAAGKLYYKGTRKRPVERSSSGRELN